MHPFDWIRSDQICPFKVVSFT